MLPMLRSLALLSLTGLIAVSWANGLKVEPVPAFDKATTGSAPTFINLSNDGPDAVGVLVVGSDSGPIEIPVELPQGSRKRVFVSPQLEVGTVPTVTLLSNRGIVRKRLSDSIPQGWGMTSIALVSDAPGQLGMLQRAKDASQFFTLDAPVENAPPRMSGYRNIRAVVLSEGAERLDDDQVSALQSYVRIGGTVLIVGGAGASVAEDPRWRALLPVINPTVQVRPRGAWLGSVDGRGLPESLTVRLGPLRPDSETLSTPILSFRPHGLGRVFYLAINPFESAYAKWQGGSSLLLRAMRYAQSARAESYLTSNVGVMAQDEWMSTMGSSTATTTGGRNPFQITLPTVDRVGLVLLGYLLCVVPLNFLILRKLKKGELAWITAPILAVGFAGALFALAQDLYQADLSTSVNAVIAVGEGSPDGVAYARAEMFFPHGGAYDLKLGQTEVVEAPTSRFRGGPFGEAASNSVPTVDDGKSVSVPRLPVSNLAFREITLMETIPGAGAWLRASRQGNDVTVTNGSPHPFPAVWLRTARASAAAVNLAPGQSRTIRLQPRLQGGPADSPISGSAGVLVEASVEGVTVGPRLGKAVASSTSTRLVTVIGGGQ